MKQRKCKRCEYWVTGKCMAKMADPKGKGGFFIYGVKRTANQVCFNDKFTLSKKELSKPKKLFRIGVGPK